MKILAFGCLFLALSVTPRSCPSQQPAAASPGVARLELTMEIAATTEDGQPTALRFTLRNIGAVSVDIPAPAIDCTGGNGSIRIRTVIHFDGSQGTGRGHGCGGGVFDGPVLLVRIRTQWFHLRPGEYLIFTGDARSMIDRADKPATYEYWAVYDPPALTAEEQTVVVRNGYVVPSEPVESDSLHFHMP